jgi:hypothetical protein
MHFNILHNFFSVTFFFRDIKMSEDERAAVRNLDYTKRQAYDRLRPKHARRREKTDERKPLLETHEQV